MSETQKTELNIPEFQLDDLLKILMDIKITSNGMISLQLEEKYCENSSR